MRMKIIFFGFPLAHDIIFELPVSISIIAIGKVMFKENR